MQWILFAILLLPMVFATESYNYLSLLNQLDMSNPMVVSEFGYLRNQKMFHLMKNVMILNQSICLTTTIRNNTLQRSPGIILKPNARATIKFYDQITSAHIQKPWIIIDKLPASYFPSDEKNLTNYFPIDVPLYFLENKMLWEHYELKSMRTTNYLGRFIVEEFIWNQNLSQNIFERRGNFNNITLFGMTETQLTFNQLPTDLEKIEQPSKVIPETYEVKANNYTLNTLVWPYKLHATQPDLRQIAAGY